MSTSNIRNQRHRRLPLVGVFAVSAVLIAIPLTTAQGAPTPAPTPGVIGGRIYRDLNNNGLADPNEPGISDIVVTASGSTITDSTGNWSMNVPLAAVKVRVSTGWYRSQCDGLDCPAGPGADNDFAVINQFITTTADGATGAQLDVGLLPDWPGSYPIPTPAAGEPIPANSVDIATRLSWIWPSSPGNCYRTADARHHGCAISDIPTGALQISNEGTTPLTGIAGYIDVPANTTILPAVPSTGPGNHPAISDLTIGAQDPVTHRAPFELVGTLPPGAAAQYILSARIEPGTPLSPLPLLVSNPYVPTEMFVTISNPLDPDGCLAEPCPRGQHDKQAPADNTDFHGWQVVGAMVAPANLDFGGVPAAEGAVRQLTIRNTGTAPFQLSSAAISGPAAADYRFVDLPNCLASPVAPGQSCAVQVSLVPTATGPRAASISLTSVGAPVNSVRLTGRAKLVAPAIRSFSQPSARPGTTIVITGSNFTFPLGQTKITFAGSSPIAVAPTDGGTTISVVVPAEAKQGPVSVTTEGGAATSSSFVVRRAPADLVVSPASGVTGAQVTITGNNLRGTTSVMFNGTAATFKVVGPNEITATVPAGSTTGLIAVTNPWGLAQSAEFKVLVA